VLIRASPATEIAVGTRILARAGALAPEGRLALRVGHDVVYLAAEGVSPTTITPYDVAAVRLHDALELQGRAPEDAERYLAALRAPDAPACVARLRDGSLAGGETVRDLVTQALGLTWESLEREAGAAGALIGAYPAE
jgi:hypothetical protein